jgi:hypothetical protein
MDTRVFSLARRDGVTLFKMNVFVFIIMVLIEAILIFIMILFNKFDADTTLVFILVTLCIAFPFVYIKIYRNATKYLTIVRFKDIMYYLQPKYTRLNHYYGNSSKKIVQISIKDKKINNV